MHEVLVNRLGGLSLPRKSVVRLTDRPDMTLDVYRGRKTTIQQHQMTIHEIIFWHVHVAPLIATIITMHFPIIHFEGDKSIVKACIINRILHLWSFEI